MSQKVAITTEWVDDRLPVWEGVENIPTPEPGEFEIVDEETFEAAVEDAVTKVLKDAGVGHLITYDGIVNPSSDTGGFPVVRLELDEDFLTVHTFLEDRDF